MRSRMSGTDELGTITVQKHGREWVLVWVQKTTTTHTAEAPEQYSVTVNGITGFVLSGHTHANSVYACVSVCMGISLNKLFRLLLMKLQADPLTFWRMTAATPQPHLMLCLGFSLNRSTAWVTPELWTEPGSTFKTSIISNLNVLQWVRCTSDRMLFDLPSFHSL